MTPEEFAAVVGLFAMRSCPVRPATALALATRERILGPGRERDEDGQVGWLGRSPEELLAEAAAEPADCAAWVVAAVQQAAQQGVALGIQDVAEAVRMSGALLAAVQRLIDALPHQTRPSQEACE